ncbi:MAG TPA: CBS domain-containing protein [Amycolatopsis sp.]|nr:CBS domain-containing protein [Amycolatopsis sp.]
MRQLRVRDVMTAEVRSVRRTTPVKDIAAILSGRKISALPVVDGERTVVGVVSEADLLSKELRSDHGASWRRHARRAGRVAEDLMRTPPVTIGPDESIVEAARRMVHKHLKRLPVVDRYGKLMGIVSRADLIRVLFVRSDESLREDIAREVFVKVLLLPADEAEAAVAVEDGVVTLTGQLERKSFVPIAVSLTGRMPGVRAVVNHLTFVLDDLPNPTPRT